jgi:hypothetical protein
MATEDDVTYGFNREQALELVGGLGQRDFNLRLYESGDSGTRSNEAIHFVSPGGGIPARTTLTMGSASCDIYTCSSGGVLSDSGVNETVYNMASSAFAGTTHGIAMRNVAGLLVAIVEDCGA